jgi:vacuolar-type H+-ATPase subunit E/Vma4
MTTANYPDSSAAAGLSGDVGSSSTGGGAKDQAKQAAGTAADEGKHVAGVAQGEAQKVASEAKSQVQNLLSQATSQVDEQSRTQKNRLVETLRTLGDDLEKMASQSEGGMAANLAREVADRTRTVSSGLDNREPSDLLDEVRAFARRKPGTILLGALVAGVVAGRVTRGAKDAQSGAASSGVTTGPSYRAPLAADVTSPGEPLSTGMAAPSSGAVYDPSTQGHGTATGDPLAGTGTPATDPVYPAGSEGLPNPGGSVAGDASWTDTGVRGDRS